MNMPNRQHIYIYHHPESKIQFLETVLIGQDWRATIVYPNQDARSLEKLNHTRSALEKRGYAVAAGQDEHGHATLQIHHIGQHSHIPDVFHEFGLVKGSVHAITHPADTLGKLLHLGKTTGNWFEGALHDPARANGIVNTVAEGFLTSAGHGAQYGKFTDPKNALQSLAGINWLAQSLTYLFFAKNNEDRAFSRIQQKIYRTLQNGGDITQIQYNEKTDSDPQNLLSPVCHFLRRYPVTIGAVMNNLGMVAYIGHAVLERKFRLGQRAANPFDTGALAYVGKEGVTGFGNFAKTGFGKDIIGASLSLAGWSALMVPPIKPRPESEEMPEETFLEKGWHKFCEHTPVIAGLFTLGASSFRLMGAKSKGNVRQQIGEKIYILGDIELMFTNSHEYGGDAKLDPEKLTNKILNHVGSLPVLLGKKEQADFVDHAMGFWLNRHKSDMATNKTRPMPLKLIERNAVEIRQELMRKICHQQGERFEHLSECLAEIIQRFPAAQHEAMIGRLTATVGELPWMRAAPTDIKTGITHALQKLSATTQPGVLSEKAIANDVATIIKIIPGIDTAVTTARLYDAVAPFMVEEAPAIMAQPANKVHSVTQMEQLAQAPASRELAKA